MKKQIIFSSLCVLMLTACNNTNSTTRHTAADNTERNVRDREGTLTSGDQSESSSDLTITQNIRSLLIKDDSLSTNAKNIKIITINGKVTLRGPVNSERERTLVADKARSVAGVSSLENQLEVVDKR